MRTFFLYNVQLVLLLFNLSKSNRVINILKKSMFWSFRPKDLLVHFSVLRVNSPFGYFVHYVDYIGFRL